MPDKSKQERVIALLEEYADCRDDLNVFEIAQEIEKIYLVDTIGTELRALEKGELVMNWVDKALGVRC
jgi:hypothetical protein